LRGARGLLVAAIAALGGEEGSKQVRKQGERRKKAAEPEKKEKGSLARNKEGPLDRGARYDRR